MNDLLLRAMDEYKKLKMAKHLFIMNNSLIYRVAPENSYPVFIFKKKKLKVMKKGDNKK